MAGGKETPRQRMIGMMYLVLTALLALQIKDTVLEKFTLMQEGLETANSSYQVDNSATVTSIAKAASDQGNKDDDVAVAETARQLRAKTEEINTFIEEMKTELEKVATGDDLEKRKERSVLKKYEEPSNYLVEKKNADVLKEELDTYNAEVLALLNRHGISRDWKTLALDASEIPLYEDNPEEKRKTFGELNFYKTPLASTLAQLTFFQNQIYARESDALGALGSQVGAESIKGFDVISGMVLPVSNVVTAGTEFEAEMFLTAANSALAPKMTRNGQPVEVDAAGRGKITFKASATDAEYDKTTGLAKKSFKAEITYNNGGEEKTIPIIHEYTVAKPTIQVGLNAVSALYLNCANNLKIDVPTLGANYQPRFTVSGGKGIPGATRGDVMIVPTQRSVKIAVASSGVDIGSVDFSARTAPLPTFKLQVNGRDYDPKQGLGSAPSSVTLFLVADADFKAAYPDDAKFFVTKGEVQLARGRTAVRRIPINGRTLSVDLSQIRAIARSGDRIVVDIEEITRYNFENTPETSTFAEIRQMTIN